MNKIDNNANLFAILDAKYYQIEFCNGKIQGQPGVQDIVKQYAYMQAFQFNEYEIVELLNVKNFKCFCCSETKLKEIPKCIT